MKAHPSPRCLPSADAAEASDPAALARAATAASGQAMRERRWADARALAALAENYGRLGERARVGAQTIQTMDLRLLFDVLTDDSGAAVARMAMAPDRRNDPDLALKEAYHALHGAACQARAHHQMALIRRIHANERQIRDLGGEVVVSQSSFDAMADERDWLLSVMADLDAVTVTPSPPPGDPWKVGM